MNRSTLCYRARHHRNVHRRWPGHGLAAGYEKRAAKTRQCSTCTDESRFFRSPRSNVQTLTPVSSVWLHPDAGTRVAPCTGAIASQVQTASRDQGASVARREVLILHLAIAGEGQLTSACDIESCKQLGGHGTGLWSLTTSPPAMITCGHGSYASTPHIVIRMLPVRLTLSLATFIMLQV